MKRAFHIIIRLVCLVILFILISVGVVGCDKSEESDSEKGRDVEFTVCDETRLPTELLEIINEKKYKDFRLTYVDKDYMYIVVGYGRHEQTNLHVAVEEFFVTEKAVYVDTELYTDQLTPTDALVEGENSIEPYIVLKCERIDLPVKFED